MSFEADLGVVDGRRLLLTLGAAIAASAGLGTAVWFGLSAMDVAAKLTEQIVTALVYTTLVGTLVIAFWPASLPPLVIRGCGLRYFLLAPVVLSLTLVASGLVYSIGSPWTGGIVASARQVLAIATDVKWIGRAPLPVWTIATIRGTLLAPLFEELLFRGVLLGWLADRYSLLVAFFVSAALFAAMHGFPIVMPYAFLFGLAANSLRLRSGSLLPGLVMHALNSLLFLAAGLEMLK